MRLPVSNVAFFCLIGFLGDCLNFTAVQSEIFLAAGIFHARELQLGLLGAATSLGYALPAMWAGVLSERMGRRPLCTFGVLGLLLSYLVIPYVQTLPQLYAICFLRSVFSAFLWVPLMAWMARAQDHEGLSGLLGKYNVSWALGILSGFYLAGVMFTGYGWRSGFHVSAGLAFVLLMFIFCCEPQGGRGAPADVDEQPVHGLEVHEVRHFVRQGLLMLTIGNFLSALVLYMFPRVGGGIVHEQGQSLLNVIRLTGQVSAFVLFGYTVNWHFRRWPLLLCGAFLCVGVLLVAVGARFAVYAAGFGLVGAGFGIAFTMSAFYALGLSESKGKGSGMMETLVGSGSLLGPLYGGAIGQMSGPRMGVVAGLIPLALIFGWAMMKPDDVRKSRGSG
ncbi:MAG: MFS transporter [Candidatus Sumerlaeaceae bacterium]